MASGAMDLVSVAYAVTNVACSVSLVLVNKLVFKGGFDFPMTLTCLHFCFTVIFYRMLAATRNFTPTNALPITESFKMAAAGVGSIGFMNISLNLNSVGFYQITKLAIVPCTLVFQAYLFGVHTSRKIKLSLSILLFGLALATVSDVHLNAPGFMLGVLAVLTTTIFQLWQGSKQKEWELSGTQLQAAVSFWQALQSMAGAAALENLCVQLPSLTEGGGGGLETPSEGAEACHTALAFVSEDGGAAHAGTMGLVLLTCLIALGTNFTSFQLIGRSSAISFQVVGHAKTCFVLAGGFVLWPPPDPRQLFYNVGGVSIAMVGCVLYGHLKLSEAMSRKDLLDRCCPPSMQPLLNPHKYELLGEDPSEEPAPGRQAATIVQRVAIATAK